MRAESEFTAAPAGLPPAQPTPIATQIHESGYEGRVASSQDIRGALVHIFPCRKNQSSWSPQPLSLPPSLWLSPLWFMTPAPTIVFRLYRISEVRFFAYASMTHSDFIVVSAPSASGRYFEGAHGFTIGNLTMVENHGVEIRREEIRREEIRREEVRREDEKRRSKKRRVISSRSQLIHLINSDEIAFKVCHGRCRVKRCLPQVSSHVSSRHT
jgi:hypothetical protein